MDLSTIAKRYPAGLVADFLDAWDDKPIDKSKQKIVGSINSIPITENVYNKIYVINSESIVISFLENFGTMKLPDIFKKSQLMRVLDLLKNDKLDDVSDDLIKLVDFLGLMTIKKKVMEDKKLKKKKKHLPVDNWIEEAMDDIFDEDMYINAPEEIQDKLIDYLKDNFDYEENRLNLKRKKVRKVLIKLDKELGVMKYHMMPKWVTKYDEEFVVK